MTGVVFGLFWACFAYVAAGIFVGLWTYHSAEERKLDLVDRTSITFLAGALWLPVALFVVLIYAPVRFVYRRLAARRRARMPRAVVVTQRVGES